MGTINLHWYNANETRSYPLSDSASAASVAGARLPTDLLADLNLRYPSVLGDYPFLASIVATGELVGLTIQCAVDPDDAATYSPVAAISMPRDDIVPGRHYPLESQYPGAGGWIVFGEGVRKPSAYSGRFNGPVAALLSPRAARPYRALPIKSMAKLYDASELTGLVLLKGEEPIAVVKEERDIEGVLRDVIVVRLVQPTSPTQNFQAGQEINVFEEFTGPCGARPESQNCGDPVPMEFINAVPPDCDGNLTLQLNGCATIAQVLQECGIVVDCKLGLTDVCVGDRLPDPAGKLRTEYDDLCHQHSETPSLGFISESPWMPPVEESLSISETVLGSLPFIERFDSHTAAHFDVVSGQFVFAADDSPSEPAPTGGSVSYSTETAAAAGQRNMAIWNGFDHSTLGRKLTVEFKLLAGIIGSQRNAGVIINYRPAADFSGRFVYFMVELSYDEQQFRFWYFNGTTFVLLPAFADLVGVALDRWYRVVVTTAPGGGSNVLLTATLTALSGPALTVTLGPFTTHSFLPDTGRFGLTSNRAYSRFSFFKLEAYP